MNQRVNGKKIHFGLLLSFLLIVISQPINAAVESPDWRLEIQERLDIANPLANRAVCLTISNGNFPLKETFFSYPLLIFATKVGLLSEQITLVPNDYREDGQIDYLYDLTDEGQKYYVYWPRLGRYGQSGFCYGRIVVDSIINVEKQSNTDAYHVSYQYRIENTPDWALLLLSDFFNGEPAATQVQVAQFVLDKEGRLVSKSGTSGYHFE